MNSNRCFLYFFASEIFILRLFLFPRSPILRIKYSRENITSTYNMSAFDWLAGRRFPSARCHPSLPRMRILVVIVPFLLVFRRPFRLNCGQNLVSRLYFHEAFLCFIFFVATMTIRMPFARQLLVAFLDLLLARVLCQVQHS